MHLRSSSHSDASEQAVPADAGPKLGSQKQIATIRTSITTKKHIGTCDSPATGAPAVTTIVRKGRPPSRKHSVEDASGEKGESSIPISQQTRRILLGQARVSLNL